jgi:predicted nuclease of restriction endonuclease-like (RecB) superfamily
LGGYFTFVGRQVRLEVSGAEYFVDLLFYHRKLRCLVAVELKKVKVGEVHRIISGDLDVLLSKLPDNS